MIKQNALQHHIQKHIVNILLFKRTARFSELRPQHIDTNVFSYHLKLLLKEEYIAKRERGYTLSNKGLEYVERVGSQLLVRSQPKVITMLLIQNGDGDVLLQKRKKQPYIDTWTLPHGKLHIDDQSINAAVKRMASEKLGLSDPNVRHVGECYIRVYSDVGLLSTSLVHAFRYETDEIAMNESVMWVNPIKLEKYYLAPAVEQIVARSFFGDKHFFAEFEHQWSDVTL